MLGDGVGVAVYEFMPYKMLFRVGLDIEADGCGVSGGTKQWVPLEFLIGLVEFLYNDFHG